MPNLRDHITSNYLLMYNYNTLPLQVSMAVIVRLLHRNPSVAGSNPGVPLFDYFNLQIIFIFYKLYN